jgi:hypothetical protein
MQGAIAQLIIRFQFLLQHPHRIAAIFLSDFAIVIGPAIPSTFSWK